ncbi:MAG: type IV pilin, partial [Nitrosomonas sp.]|nr:type IV pilin [Nitrosomonas sp.]
TQSPRTGTAKYTIQFAATPTQNSYTLEAVPTGFMASDTCGTLTLAQTGARGADGDVIKCWQ